MAQTGDTQTLTDGTREAVSAQSQTRFLFIVMPAWYLTFILTWLLGTGTLFAAIFTKEQTIRVREFIQTVMRCTKIPGLSLAVVKGEETWTEGYGVSDMSSGRAVTSSTLFGVGSITKAFTVSLLSMFLNESSSLSWEAPVAAILGRPDFRLGDDYMSNHVTLTHRTGLTASSWLFFAGFPDSMSLGLFEKRLRYLPISRPFRDGYMYNWMYCLVGRVVELLGGASWEELLRTRLLQPIGMKHTFTFSAASRLQPEDELATAYMTDGETPVPINTSVYVDIHPCLLAGGMITSADDMSLWMHVLLRRGITRDGTRVLRESSLKEMQSARVLVPADMGTFLSEPRFPVTYTDNGYGFAWFTAQYRGK